MHCQYCDTELPAGVSFCTNCGARVPEATPSSAGQPTTNLPDGSFQLPPTPSRPTVAPPAAAPYLPQGTLPPAVYVQVPPNSNSATVSLIFGILSWFLLPLLGAIVAVVAGHMARREIRESGGRVGGAGMATAGLILGYAHMAALVIVACLAILFFIVGAAVITTNS